MAAESLLIKKAGSSGAELSLTSGSVWSLESLDLGNGSERNEFVSSTDSHGARPARLAYRDNRVVSVRLRLTDPGSADNVMTKIGQIDELLYEATSIASDDVSEPIDFVRLVWTPKDSTKSYFLPIYGGSITGVPKVTSGDDLGWFLRVPVITVEFLCDPTGFGSATEVLNATVNSSAFSQGFTIPPIVSDIEPWTKVTLGDTASKQRSSIVVGLRRNETANAGIILPADLTTTGFTGTVSGAFITSLTQSVWTTMAQLPTQTRTGRFRVYAVGANTGGGSSQIRLVWREVSSSRRQLPAASITSGGGRQDVLLGEISPGNSWESWIETLGNVSLAGIVLVPVDSSLYAVGPGSGENAVAGTVGSDSFESDTPTTTKNLSGRSNDGYTWSTTGTGTWQTDGLFTQGDAWIESATGVSTPSIGLYSQTFGLDVDVSSRFFLYSGSSGNRNSSNLPTVGFLARYVDASNYMIVGMRTTGATSVVPVVVLRRLGTNYTLWEGAPFTIPLGFGGFDYPVYARLQVTSDGRWWAEFIGYVGSAELFRYSIGGQAGALISGEGLGSASTKVGLYSSYTSTSIAVVRAVEYLIVRNVVGLTPPPIQSSQSVVWRPGQLRNSSGSEYPYAGASDLRLQPNVSNNVVLMWRRGAVENDRPTAASLASAQNDSGTIAVSCYPRFLNVPR